MKPFWFVNTKAQANSRKLLTLFCVLFLCSPYDELGTWVWALALRVFIPQKMFATEAFQVTQNKKKKKKKIHY